MVDLAILQMTHLLELRLVSAKATMDRHRVRVWKTRSSHSLTRRLAHLQRLLSRDVLDLLPTVPLQSSPANNSHKVSRATLGPTRATQARTVSMAVLVVLAHTQVNLSKVSTVAMAVLDSVSTEATTLAEVGASMAVTSPAHSQSAQLELATNTMYYDMDEHGPLFSITENGVTKALVFFSTAV